MAVAVTTAAALLLQLPFFANAAEDAAVGVADAVTEDPCDRRTDGQTDGR